MRVEVDAPLATAWIDWGPRATLVVKTSYRYSGGLLVSLDSPVPVHDVDRIPWKRFPELLVVGHAKSLEPRQVIQVEVAVGDGFQRTCYARASSPTSAVPLTSEYLRGADGKASTRTGPELSVAPEWAEQPLAADFDFSAFNAAPQEQWLESIAPGAALALTGLSATAATVRLQLPKEAPQAHVVGHDGSTTGIELSCDTLWLDVDEEVVSLVWRGVVGPPIPRGTCAVFLPSPDTTKTAVRKPRAPARTEKVDFDELRERGEALPFLPGAPGDRSLPPHLMRALAEASQAGETVAVNAGPDSQAGNDTLDIPHSKGASSSPQLPFTQGERALPRHLASALAGLDPAAAGATVALDALRPVQHAPHPFQRDTAPSAAEPPVAPTQSAVPPLVSSTPPIAHSPVAPPPPPAPGPDRAPRPEPVEVREQPRLELAVVARVKAAMLDGTSLGDALEDHGVDEKMWRYSDRMLIIDLAKERTSGRQELATALDVAIAASRKKPSAVAPQDEVELDLYLSVQIELDEADDPGRVLQDLGLDAARWQEMRMTWTRRALADPKLAQQIRAQLVERRRQRRRIDGSA